MTENNDKDLPLRDDIRLLGRLLGDTVREQEGDDVFAVVEKIRQTSTKFDRDADAQAGAELQTILDDLPRETMIAVVRAFSYFLHLANIAEDQHHIRRRRTHDLAGSKPREGSLAHTLERIKARICCGHVSTQGVRRPGPAARVRPCRQPKGSAAPPVR